ncbi:hypothetical protein FB451DRAFT_1285488 [Mycena latifolia]|nr:hypothetical protein FB451DRAFT_1285488 [Mycena latifolia]
MFKKRRCRKSRPALSGAESHATRMSSIDVAGGLTEPASLASEEIPRCHYGTPRPTLYGGTGGHGGRGGKIGGAGGLGQASHFPLKEIHRFSHLSGGTGGEGGEGGNQGGDGGIGQGLKFGTRLASVDEGIVLPPLRLAEFCQRYCLSDRIRKLLGDQGFETAGALLEVSDVSLLDDGFLPGHIAEMKRALKEFLLQQGVQVYGQ